MKRKELIGWQVSAWRFVRMEQGGSSGRETERGQLERHLLADVLRAGQQAHLQAKEAHRFAAEALARLSKLREVATLLSQTHDPATMIDTIVDVGLAPVGDGAGLLAIVSEHGDEVGLVASGGIRRAMEASDHLLSPNDESSLLRGLYLEEAMWLEASEPCAWPLISGIPWVVLPLRFANRTVGSLALGVHTLERFSEVDRLYLLALARQCAEALERGRLHRELAGESARWRLLAEASAALGNTLDQPTMLRSLAPLLVPMLGDWCTIDVVDEGSITRVACVHADPQRATLANRLRDHSPNRAFSSCITRVMETRRPELGMGKLPAVNLDADHLDVLGELGASSYLCVPAIARERTMAVVTLARTRKAAEYAQKEISLAIELAGRLAVGLDQGRLYDSARQAIHDRQDLMAVVSHELKGPLTAIRLSASMLAKHTEQRVASAIGPIVRAASHMNRLVSDLTDVAAIEARSLSVQATTVPCRDLLDEAVEQLGPAAHERGIVLEKTDDAKRSTWCDRGRMVQVLTNLIGNAIRVTARGGTVVVSSEARDAYTEFAVHDGGPGIPAHVAPRIFDKYWSGSGSSGLGLFISKGIMEAHGGRIWFEARPDGGTTFRFTLQDGRLAPSTG
jgi:signal transduction histidine kinase